MEPHERARAGLFLAFQRPVAISGVKMADFLRHAVTNVRRPDRKEGEELIPMREFRKSPHEIALPYPTNTAPPFTFSTSPEMKPASGVHKNNTGPAISSALPGRPRGIPEAIFGPNVESASVAADMSVVTQPGATQFTRIPFGANSLDRLFVRLIKAPFVTA